MFAALQPWNVMVPGTWGPPDKVYLFDDFVAVAAVPSPTNEASAWNVGTTAPVVTRLSYLGGAVRFASQAAEETFFRTTGNAFEMPARGKTLYYETRIRPGDADDAAILIGLATPDVAAPIAGLTDFIGFEKVVDVVTLNTRIEVATAETSTDTTYDAADNTWVRLAFFIDANGRCTFYVDGVKKVETTTLPAVGTALQPVYALSLDAGTADAVDIDYIIVAQDR